MSQKPSHQASKEKPKEISLIFNYTLNCSEDCPDAALDRAKQCIESFFSWKYDQLGKELALRLYEKTNQRVDLMLGEESGLTSGWLGTQGFTSMFNECDVLGCLNHVHKQV